MSKEEAIDCECNADGDHSDHKQNKKPIVYRRRKRARDADNDHQNEQQSSYSQWSNLPADVMEIILDKMHLSDYASVLGVCQPWRAVAKPHYIKPYLVNLSCNRWSTDAWMINVENCKMLHIRHPVLDEMYCVGSSHGWLILRKENSPRVCLMNLFNGAKFNLPKWFPRIYSGCIYLSSSPNSANCIVLVIGKFVPGMAFCRLGDSRWNFVEKDYFNLEKSEYLDQAVAWGDKFYVLTSLGRLATINDVRQPRTVTILGENKVVPSRKVFKYYNYFLQSEGQLLAVFLCIPGLVRSIVHVEVFRYDFESAAWVQMEKLDGRTLFVGFNCSFAQRSEKDYVYFPDNSSDGWIKYDMERKLVIETLSHDYNFPTDPCDRVWILPTLEYPASMQLNTIS